MTTFGLLIQSKLGVLHQAGLAREDFSKADSTTVKSIAQKTLFDCFGDLISEEDFSASPQCEGSSKAEWESTHNDSERSADNSVSNWFDNLDENDFNFIDMNT